MFLLGFISGVIGTGLFAIYMVFRFYSEVANEMDDPCICSKYDDTESYNHSDITLISSKQTEKQSI
jgi:hypothetical protein